MAAKIGSLFIDLRAGVGNLQKDLERSVSKTRAQMNKAAKVLGVAALAMAASIGVASAKGAASLDELSKSAEKMGVAIDQMQGLREAAKQFSGVANTTFDMALQRMVRRVSEAAQGSGEAKNALKELGVDAKALAKLSPDEQFKRLADSFQDVATQGDRVRLAMRLFDSEGVALVNTMMAGREAIEGVQARMEALGLTMTQLEADKVEEMNDALSLLKAVGNAASMQMAAQLAPAVTAVTQEVLRLIENAGGLRTIMANVTNGAITGFAMLSTVVHGWNLLMKEGELLMLRMFNAIPTDFFAAILTDAERQAMETFQKGIPGAIAVTKEELNNLSAEDPLKKVTDKMKDFQTGVTGSFFGVIDGITAGAEEVAEKWTQTTGAIEDALTNMVTKGKLDARSLVDTIINEFVRLQVVKPLMDALGGGGSGGGIASFIGDLFRADGGPVRGGQSYIVGEQGPELFTPNASGFITPNGLMGAAAVGGGQTIVNQTINFPIVPDSTIDNRIRKAAPLLVEATKGGVQDEALRRA